MSSGFLKNENFDIKNMNFEKNNDFFESFENMLKADFYFFYFPVLLLIMISYESVQIIFELKVMYGDCKMEVIIGGRVFLLEVLCYG